MTKLALKLTLALIGALALSTALPARSAETHAPDYDALSKSSIETVTRFIEADTTNPPGNESRVVKLVAKRLDEAGIPYEITEFAPGRENIVARLKATGTPVGKPLMLLAHTDVVTAAGQSWTSDPHKVTSKDGFLVARGIADDLGMAAVNLEVFILLKKSGVPLKRDVILALTGDEESDGHGIQYLLKNKPESIDAGIAFNEGGNPVLGKDGKLEYLEFSAAEKTYQDFELITHGTTGHSSIPRKDNAIYRLAHALTRLEASPEAPHLIPVTRAYFAAKASLEKPPISDAMRALAHSKNGKLPPKALQVLESDPLIAAALRTTCVATLLKAGTRVNALPADATANVNCRILPDETAAATRARLEKIIDDPQVEVRSVKVSQPGPASPIDGDAMHAIEKVTHEMWPGLPIIPSLLRAATDSHFLRQAGVAAYGINPLALTETDAMRMHGIDERVPASSFRTGVEYLHKLVLEIASR